MMRTKEFIETCTENVTNELESRWGVQRDSNGKHFLYSPFPGKEDFLERYEAEIQDPWDELEDIDELAQVDIESMENEGREKVEKVYERIKQIRQDFWDGRGMDEEE